MSAVPADRSAVAQIPPSPFDPDDVDRAADQILSDPEFDYSPSLLDRIGDWVGDRITDLLDRLGGLGGGATGSIVGYSVLALMIAAAAWLIWRVVRDRLPQPVDARNEPVITTTPWRLAADLRADAEAFMAEGQHREAARAWYRWTIASLVEAERIGNPPGRTSGEYLTEVASRVPPAAVDFARVTDIFEQLWYGDTVEATSELADEVRVAGHRVLATSTTLVQA